MSSAISSPSSRRVHYHSQNSNTSLSHSQTHSMMETLNLNDSFPSFNHPNPLVTIICTSTSSSKVRQRVRTESNVSSISSKTRGREEKTTMETSRRNSSMSYIAPGKAAEIKKQFLSGACTFIRIIFGDNQQLLINSYSSCRRLLDYLKPVIGIQQDETIDLMDNEGKLKELNMHDDEYASTYLTARNTYYVFKIEIIDAATNEKRYTAFFNMDQIDQKLHSILQNSLTSLNSSSKVSKGGRRTNIGTSKPTSSAQLSSNTTQSKGKKTIKLK